MFRLNRAVAGLAVVAVLSAIVVAGLSATVTSGAPTDVGPPPAAPIDPSGGQLGVGNGQTGTNPSGGQLGVGNGQTGGGGTNPSALPNTGAADNNTDARLAEALTLLGIAGAATAVIGAAAVKARRRS